MVEIMDRQEQLAPLLNVAHAGDGAVAHIHREEIREAIGLRICIGVQIKQPVIAIAKQFRQPQAQVADQGQGILRQGFPFQPGRQINDLAPDTQRREMCRY